MKLRKKAKKIDSSTITHLKMSSGRVVTDPDEIQRLLKAEGFTISEGGRLGLSDRLRRRPQ